MGVRRVACNWLWGRLRGLGRHGIGAEIERGDKLTGRVRRCGAGRPRLEDRQLGLADALEKLVDPVTRGDPMSLLRWTCKSRAKLAAALTLEGWSISSTTVGRMLNELGYRLQSVNKRNEGKSDPDRNAQLSTSMPPPRHTRHRANP